MMQEQSEQYFETIKCDDYEVFHLDYHKKRMSDTVGINFNLEEYIYPPTSELLKCKVIYTKDEIINIEYSPYSPKEVKTFKLIEDDSLDYRYKYLDRSNIDFHYNNKKDTDEIIIVQNDLITDTSIANIAIKKNNQWFTPSKPLLKGTTRARLLEEGFLKEYPITSHDLLKAKEFAIMNAMIGFQEIKEFKFIT